MTAPEVTIGDRRVATGEPMWVIAEISANHNGDLGRALELIRAAAAAGVDAVKFQTYTADSMTLDLDTGPFRIGPGTLWEGRGLHELYREAATPYEWHDDLFAEAERSGVVPFSTPFDAEAVDFLERYDPPVHKIASFELVDLALIRRAAATGKVLIMSTGMATEDEVDEAVKAATDGGAGGVVLLRCNSAYPAPPGEMDLRTIPDMAERWGVPVGLSDHTLGSNAAITGRALGACVLEKHVTLARSDGGPDAAFSLEPDELQDLVTALREAEASLGGVRYGPAERETASLAFRRSLFVIEDVAEGEVLTEANVRAIRPGDGLAPRHLDEVLGRRATRAIERGTPLDWDLLA
ncbi:MAG TPA: pseudaminic acid synthase [Acidimicrobiales bacterium]|nr:pseudaminic acid synthase [Acidimicrobiales bacterium]